MKRKRDINNTCLRDSVYYEHFDWLTTFKHDAPQATIANHEASQLDM